MTVKGQKQVTSPRSSTSPREGSICSVMVTNALASSSVRSSSAGSGAADGTADMGEGTDVQEEGLTGESHVGWQPEERLADIEERAEWSGSEDDDFMIELPQPELYDRWIAHGAVSGAALRRPASAPMHPAYETVVQPAVSEDEDSDSSGRSTPEQSLPTKGLPYISKRGFSGFRMAKVYRRDRKDSSNARPATCQHRRPTALGSLGEVASAAVPQRRLKPEPVCLEQVLKQKQQKARTPTGPESAPLNGAGLGSEPYLRWLQQRRQQDPGSSDVEV
eukprot:TRINITY_DN11461_c0_g1_i4.p1 TRINITY_DN11461_c0_g1~~TRINITY_DN11461_c0_g1_i4.p1  ORF type:complete len:277 (+),score=50.90 TRINITY_DN11461_c0_g1_i4:304-1134(+)